MYRNSPFLILDSFSDEQNINSGPDKLALEDKEHHGTINEIDIEEPFEIRHALEELPNKGKVSRSIGPICRELLNDVGNLTFPVDDESELLHTTKEKLEEIRTILNGLIQKQIKTCCWSHNKQKIEKEKLT